MSFDLVVWKSDRPLSPQEALAMARTLAEGGDAGVRPAEGIGSFAREVERRYGGHGLLGRFVSPYYRARQGYPIDGTILLNSRECEVALGLNRARGEQRWTRQRPKEA